MGLCCAFTLLLTSFGSIYSYFINQSFLYSIGVMFVSFYATNAIISLLKAIYVYNFAPKVNFSKKYGNTAVITGATDGIGKAYAIELASNYNMNLVLISRTQSKLDEIKKEIEQNCNVKVQTIAADFSNTEHAMYEKIKQQIFGKNQENDREIGILINNVGAGYNHPDVYTKIDENNDIDRLLSINCFPQAKMTHMILSHMIARKRGVIISLSSFSAIYPMPLLALYSACKNFNMYFSESLRRETALKSKDIVFQTIQPYFVTTKLAKIRNPSLLIPTPKTFVKSALKSVGYYNVTTGHFAQELYSGVTQFLHKVPVISGIVENVTYGHLASTMKRAYKKKEAAKKQ